MSQLPTPYTLPSAAPEPAPVVATAEQVSVVVPYMTPHARALNSAQRVALANLASSILVILLRELLVFLQGGSYTVAALQAVGIAAAIAVITTLMTYVQKYVEANGTTPAATPASTETHGF